MVKKNRTLGKSETPIFRNPLGSVNRTDLS